MRKIAKAVALVPVVIALTAGAALALNQTSGQGLTAEGNSLGFNAKADLSGHLTYVTHDGSGLVVFWLQLLPRGHERGRIPPRPRDGDVCGR